MLHWFGHRGDCPSPLVPSERGDEWLVCARCMPDVVPTCPLCGRTADLLGVRDGFARYAFGRLCPPCVARVHDAGPAAVRRAHVLASRVEALLDAYPSLHVSEQARRRVALEGAVRGRRVWLTLKMSAREYEDERYVYRVELRRAPPPGALAAIEPPPLLRAPASLTPLAVVDDRFRHLRAAFLHLGRRDAIHALEDIIAIAERLDAV